MNVLNNIASSNKPRRLLVGERAEVRQRERGLRGSWHSGTIVKVKSGRRVVEYDELFSKDGSMKLKECISLYEEIRSQTSGRRGTPILELDKGGPIDSNKRGFIRPIPPCCLVPSRHNWKRGLLVDAFYNDAWWEGILLHDVGSSDCEFKTRIFFPDEGDELEVLLKDIRVSQEWDEARGMWAVRGYWFFEGRGDVGPLKKICRKAPCPLKALWRQKRFCSSEDLAIQEERINNQHEAENTLQVEKQEIPVEPMSMEAVICEKTNYEEGACVKEEKYRIMKDNISLSVEAGENIIVVDGSNHTGYTTDIIRKESDLVLTHIPILDGKMVDASRYKLSIEGSVQNTKKRKISLCDDEAKMRRRITRSTFDLGKRTSDDGQTGSYKQEEYREDDLYSKAMVDTLSSVCKYTCREVDTNDSRKVDGIISPENYMPSKVGLHEARNAAREFLLSNGWKIESRIRPRGSSGMRNESLYISPDGCRFVSLTSACRGLRTDREISSSSVSSKQKIIDSYMIAGGLKLPFAEQITRSDGSTKDLYNNDSTHVPERMDSRCGSATLEKKNAKLDVPTQCHEVIKVKKRKLTLIMESSYKRKNEGNNETKHKRGSLPLKGNRNMQENKGSGVDGSCRMQVLMSFPERGTEQNASQDIGEQPQFKKSTVLSWLIDKDILKENEPVFYVNRKDGRIMKTGKVTREGVMCDCCKDIFTLSNFEAHAGSKLHRPSANIFLHDGRSVSDCQLEACALQDVKEKEGIIDVSDDTCGICKDGGELILCDNCPSTFHVDCIGLKVIPEGEWYCPKCSCGVCGANQLTADLDSRMFRCTQCELEYHLSCVPACPIDPLNQATPCAWFCDKKCQQIFVGLRRQVGVAHPMENGFSWMLLRSMKKEQVLSQSGLELMAEHHSKLSVAHCVMQECFMPMIDPRTKVNLISQALYNRRSKVDRLNYGGFYTILLERGDELISVATIRVHGARFAEMPLIGTRYQYRRQGMCRRLVNALEEMLTSIGVEKLILPAVPELQDTWIDAFGFQQMSLPDVQELSKLNLMTFPGTSLLQKHLLKSLSDSVDHSHSYVCLETPSYKSVEKLFTMAHSSLYNGFREGNINEDIPSMNSWMFDYTQEIISDNQGITVPSNIGRPKNRIQYKAAAQSHDDASGVGKCRDDDIYTRVVVGTTRSKRLVKSTRWVADGLRELKDSKQFKRNSLVEGNSTKRPAKQSVKNGANAEDTAVRHTNTLNGSMHLLYTSNVLMDEIQFCPKTYVRRKKRKNTQHDTKANNVSVDQTSTTPINGSNQEFVSSSIPSFCPSLIGRLLHGQDMLANDLNVVGGMRMSVHGPNFIHGNVEIADGFNRIGGKVEMLADDSNVTSEEIEILANDSIIIGYRAEVAANNSNVLCHDTEIKADDSNVTSGNIENLVDDSNALGATVEMPDHFNARCENAEIVAVDFRGCNADMPSDDFSGTLGNAKFLANVFNPTCNNIEMAMDDFNISVSNGGMLSNDFNTGGGANKGIQANGFKFTDGNAETLNNDLNATCGNTAIQENASKATHSNGEIFVSDSNAKCVIAIPDKELNATHSNANILDNDPSAMYNNREIVAGDINNTCSRAEMPVHIINVKQFGNGEISTDGFTARDGPVEIWSADFDATCGNKVFSADDSNPTCGKAEVLANDFNAMCGKDENLNDDFRTCGDAAMPTGDFSVAHGTSFILSDDINVKVGDVEIQTDGPNGIGHIAKLPTDDFSATEGNIKALSSDCSTNNNKNCNSLMLTDNFDVLCGNTKNSIERLSSGAVNSLQRLAV